MESSFHQFPAEVQKCRLVHELPRTIACQKCGSSSSKYAAMRWLESAKCTGTSKQERGGPLELRPEITVGRSVLHPSHRLKLFHRRWWVCITCGAYAAATKKASPKNLCKQCSGKAYKQGKKVLERLHAGLTPRKEID
eukprot:9738553-Karenia_brevis.AAC.1